MVKRLMRLWELYSKVNTTNIDKSIFDDWESFLNDTASFIHEFDFVKDMAVEDPGDSPVIAASFGAKQMLENTTDFLPFFGTDFGFCSLIKPQLNFNKNYSEFSFSKLYGPIKTKDESVPQTSYRSLFFRAFLS